MKKTFTNTLPEDMEVINTEVKIENDKIITSVELGEKYKPKNGDFVTDSIGNVYIYKEKDICYVCATIIGELKFDSFVNPNNRLSKCDEIRFIIDILAKNNLKWNTATNKLENLNPFKKGDIVRVNVLDDLHSRPYMVCVIPSNELPDYEDSYFNIANVDLAGNLCFECYYNESYILTPATDADIEELKAKLKEVGLKLNTTNSSLTSINDILQACHYAIVTYPQPLIIPINSKDCGFNNFDNFNEALEAFKKIHTILLNYD